jgi:hypothetical protein
MSDIDTIREALDWLPGIDEKIHALAALDRLQAQQPKTLSDDEIDQIVIVNHERIENEDFDSYESFAEAVTFEHGRRFGIKEGLEIARENGYLSQSNAEPVAWAYFGDFPDGKRLISADNTNLWGSDGIPLYTHPPASTEPRLTVEQAMEVFRQWRALNTNGWSADAIWENLFTCLTKAAKP